MTEAAGPWNIGQRASDYTAGKPEDVGRGSSETSVLVTRLLGMTLWKRCLLNHLRAHFKSSLSNWFAANNREQCR